MCSRSATVTFYLISLPFGLRTENPLHRKHQQPSQKSPKSAMFDSWTLDSFYEKDRPTHSKVTVGFLIFKKAVWLSGQLLLFALVCSQWFLFVYIAQHNIKNKNSQLSIHCIHLYIFFECRKCVTCESCIEIISGYQLRRNELNIPAENISQQQQ